MARNAMHEHQRRIAPTDIVKSERHSVAHEMRHRASLHDSRAYA